MLPRQFAPVVEVHRHINRLLGLALCPICDFFRGENVSRRRTLDQDGRDSLRKGLITITFWVGLRQF